MLLDTLVDNGLKSYCLGNKIQTPKQKRTCSAGFPIGSKEESSHPPANALSVIQDVELVDELVHTVAGLGDGA